MRNRIEAAVHKDEVVLVIGLWLLSVAAALSHFVIIGLLGLLLFPVAFGTVAAAGVMARDRRLPAGIAVAGLALFLAGDVALILASWRLVHVAFLAARYVQIPRLPAPGIGAWVAAAAFCLVPAVAVGAGLQLRSGRSTARCLAWAAAVLVALASAALLFFAGVLANAPIST